MHRQKTQLVSEREDKLHKKKRGRTVSEVPKKLMCKTCTGVILHLNQEVAFYYCKRCWEGSGFTTMYHVCETCYCKARDADVEVTRVTTHGDSADLRYDAIALSDQVIDLRSLQALPLPGAADDEVDDADTRAVRPRSYSEDLLPGTVGDMDARSRRRTARELRRRESSKGGDMPGSHLSSRRTMPALTLHGSLHLDTRDDNAQAVRSSRSEDGPSRNAYDFNGKQHSARLGTYASYAINGGLSPIPATPLVDDEGIFFDPTQEQKMAQLEASLQQRSFQPMPMEQGQMAAPYQDLHRAWDQHVQYQHAQLVEHQQVRSSTPSVISAVDTNGDGMIDTISYDTTGDGRIDKIEYDTNHDGKVNKIEYDTSRDGKVDTIKHDTNHDGKFDKIEYDTNHDGKFDKIEYDTNHDGMIDTIMFDTNDDGKIDRIEYATNHDGNIDDIESLA
jgi:hypothetical protein